MGWVIATSSVFSCFLHMTVARPSRPPLQSPSIALQDTQFQPRDNDVLLVTGILVIIIIIITIPSSCLPSSRSSKWCQIAIETFSQAIYTPFFFKLLPPNPKPLTVELLPQIDRGSTLDFNAFAAIYHCFAVRQPAGFNQFRI